MKWVTVNARIVATIITILLMLLYTKIPWLWICSYWEGRTQYWSRHRHQHQRYCEGTPFRNKTITITTINLMNWKSIPNVIKQLIITMNRNIHSGTIITPHVCFTLLGAVRILGEDHLFSAYWSCLAEYYPLERWVGWFYGHLCGGGGDIWCSCKSCWHHWDTKPIEIVWTSQLEMKIQLELCVT